MRKYRNRFITGIIIALVIYVGLLLFLDSQGQLTDDMMLRLRAFPWRYIPLVIALQFVAWTFRFLEWQYFLGVIDARDKISVADSAIIFVSGFAMVVSPGKAAEMLKAIFLKTKTGVPVAKSVPIVIAERVVDGLAVVVIMTLGILLASDVIEIGPYRLLILSCAGILGAGLIVVQIVPLAYFILNITAKLPLLRRLYPALVEFYESSREIFKLKHIIPTTILGVGVYLSTSLGFLVILLGFGLDYSWTLAVQTAFINGVAAAVGALSFVPNGAGVTEISNTALLRDIVAPTQPALTIGIAGAAAIMQGFFNKWLRVVVGVAVLFLFRKRLFSEELEMEIANAEAEIADQRADYTAESNPA